MEPRAEMRQYHEVASDGRTPYIPDVLAAQIDRYEKNIAVLEGRLRPVLSQHTLAYVREERPEEVSEHQLHEQMNRLENANQRLEDVIGQIAL